MSSIQVNGEEPTRIMAGAEPVERLAIGGKDVWANWNPALDDNLVCWLDASDGSTITVSDNSQSLEIPISNIEFSTQDNDWGMAIFTTAQPHGLSENQPIELNIGEPWTDTTYAAGVIDGTSLYIYKDNSQINETTQLTIERFLVDDLAYDDPSGADGEGYFYSGYGPGWRYQLRFMFAQDVSAYNGTQITFTGGKWNNMFNGFSGSTQLNLSKLNGQTLTFVVSPHNNKMVRLMDTTKHQWEFTNATSSDGGYLITKPGVDAANNAPHPIADWINPGANTAWTDSNSSGTVYKQTTDGKDIDVGWQAPYIFASVQDGSVEIDALYNTMMLPLSGDDEPVAWYTAKYINNFSEGYPYYTAGSMVSNGTRMNPVSTYNPDTSTGDGAGTFVDPDAPVSTGGGENLDVNGQIYRWDDATMTPIRNNLSTNSAPAGQIPSARRPNAVVYPQTFPGLSINDIGLDSATGSIIVDVPQTVVDSIQDKSGNNNTFFANSIDKPSISTIKTNGRDTITFNTQTIRGATGIYGEQTLKNETLNLKMPSTIHMVYKTSSTNNYDHPLELFSGITNETSKERWRLTTYEQPTDVLYPGVNLNNHPDQEPQFPKGGRVQLHAEGKHPASHVFRIEPRTEGGTQVKFYRCIKTHTCPLVDQEPEKAPGYPSSEYWQEVTKPTGNMWSGDSELFPGVSKVTRINETHVELWSAHTGDARIGGMQRGMLINMEPPGSDNPANAWNQRYMSPTWPANDEATLQETWQEKIIHLAPVSTGDSGNNYRYTVKNSELSSSYGQYPVAEGTSMPSLNNLDWSPEDCWFIPWDIRRTQSTGSSRIHGPLVQNWDDIISDNGSFHGNGRHSTINLTRSSFIFHQEQTEDSYVMYEGSKYRCIKSNKGNSPDNTNYWQNVETTGGTTPEWSNTEYYYSMTPVDVMSLNDNQWKPTNSLEALPTSAPALPCKTFDDPEQVNILTIRWENQMTAPRVYLNGQYLGQSGTRDMLRQSPTSNYYFRPDITALQLAANNPNGVVLGADSNNSSINNGIWSLCEMIISSNIDISTLLKTHGYLCNKWRADVHSEFKYYNRLPSTFDDVSDKWSPLKTSSTPGIDFTTPVTKVVDIDASTETSITTGYGGYPVVDIASRSSEYPWEFNTTGDIIYSTGDQLHFTGTGDATYDGNTFYINKISDTKLTLSSSNSEPTVVTVPVTMFSGLASKNIDQPMMTPELQVSNYRASYIPMAAKNGFHSTNHSLFWPHRISMSYVTHPAHPDQPYGPVDRTRLMNYEFDIDWDSPALNSYWYEQIDQLALYRRLTYGSLVIDPADLPQVTGENVYVTVEDMTGFLTTFEHYDNNAPGISVGDVLYLKKSRAGLTTSTQMEELTAYTVQDGGQFSIYDTLSLTNPFLPATTADYFQLSPCYKYTSTKAPYAPPDGVGLFKGADTDATYEATAKLDDPMYRVSYRGDPDHYNITTNSSEWWSDHTGTITLKIFNEDHPNDSRLSRNYSSAQLGGVGGVERLDSSTGVSVSFSQSDTSKKPLKDTSTGRSAIKFDINSVGEMDTLTNTGNIFDISSGTELNEYTIGLMATVKLPSNGQVDIIRQNDNNFKVTVDNQGFIRVFQHGSAMIVNQFVKTGEPFILVMYQKDNIKYARLNGAQQAYEFSASGLSVTDQWHIAGGVARDQEISISNIYAYIGDVFDSDIEKLEGELTRANRQRKLLPKNHPYRYRSV